MKSLRMFLAASAVFCLTWKVSAAERPWVLEKDDEGRDGSPLATYVKNLGKEDSKDVKALDKALRERVAEARKIVAADGPGKAEAEKEIARYEKFLDMVSDPVRFGFNGKIDLAKKTMTFDSYKVYVYRRTTLVQRRSLDKKYYFFGSNGEPEYLRGKDLELAKIEIQRMGYISLFCGNQNPDPGQTYMQYSSKAAVCCIYGRQALKNNSIDVVIKHPMPAKGALHDALEKEALACARGRFPEAEGVLINSNDWEIQRNRFGVIIRRVAWGWIIVKDDIGRRTIPAKWEQPNQGGSAYGKLQLFRYGGNNWFYLK